MISPDSEPSYNRILLERLPAVEVTGRKLFRVIPSNLEHCWPACTGGYILSRKGAQRLLAAPERQHTFVDIFLFNKLESPIAGKIATYQVVPALCIQDKFIHIDDADIVYKSEIDPVKIDKNKLEPLMRSVNLLRNFFLYFKGYRKIQFVE